MSPLLGRRPILVLFSTPWRDSLLSGAELCLLPLKGYPGALCGEVTLRAEVRKKLSIAQKGSRSIPPRLFPYGQKFQKLSLPGWRAAAEPSDVLLLGNLVPKALRKFLDFFRSGRGSL